MGIGNCMRLPCVLLSPGKSPSVWPLDLGNAATATPSPQQQDLPPSLLLAPQSDMKVSAHFPSLPSGQLMAHLRGLVLLFLEGRPQASPDRARAEARVGSCGAMDLPWVLDPWAPSCLVLFKGLVCRAPSLGRPSSWLSLGPVVGLLTVAAALSTALGPSAACNWGWGSGLPSCTPWNSELPASLPQT